MESWVGSSESRSGNEKKQTMAPPPHIIWLNLKVDLFLETPEKEKCNS